jgi:amino acid transporter
MHYQPVIAIVAIDATALLAAGTYGYMGWREMRADPPFAPGRFAVSFAALAVAALVGFRVMLPVVGYALLAIALVSVFVYDEILEERSRRRRVASLNPRPPVNWQLLLWIGLAAGSAIGIIFVFTSFVNADLASPLPVQYTFQKIAFVAMVSILAWTFLLGRMLDRRFPSPS